ncbi:GFA family protein [Lysobacter tyrosinilyticus]
MSSAGFPCEGGCTCRAVRYRMEVAPMVVHACHCRWCQRESGTAFALNAVVERAQVTLLLGEVEVVPVPSESGKGQRIVRCPQCRVALWSHYPGGGEEIAFVRVGTLDHPELAPPDVHIYTASKQSWLTLPAGARAFAEFYDPRVEWPAKSLQRWGAAKTAARPAGEA